MTLNELKCISDNIDLDQYITFREEVKSHMEHPEWLGDFTKEDLKELLKRDSKIWVYYLDNTPICSQFGISALKISDIN